MEPVPTTEKIASLAAGISECYEPWLAIRTSVTLKYLERFDVLLRSFPVNPLLRRKYLPPNYYETNAA